MSRTVTAKSEGKKRGEGVCHVSKKWAQEAYVDRVTLQRELAV